MLVARIRAFTEAFLTHKAHLFDKCIARNHIRDCQGDLHAGSIGLTAPIQFFDCIEFSDSFHYGDVAAELAFIAMDLEHFGRTALTWHFANAFRKAFSDSIPDNLLALYACYRAVVGAKVESFKLNDPGFTADKRGSAREPPASSSTLPSRMPESPRLRRWL